jgi:hypothetical protein
MKYIRLGATLVIPETRILELRSRQEPDECVLVYGEGLTHNVAYLTCSLAHAVARLLTDAAPLLPVRSPP